MRRGYRFFSMRTLVLLGMFIAVTSLAAGYRTAQIYNIEKSNYEEGKNQKRDNKVRKVAEFYMEQNPRLWEHLALYMAEHTVLASETYKVPLKIAVGIVATESTANPFAKSVTGCIGSSQVDFKAHEDTFITIKTSRDRYDPKYNIPAGMYLLQGYIKKYGVKNALQVYNVGEGAFSRGKRNPKYGKEVFATASEFDL